MSELNMATTWAMSHARAGDESCMCGALDGESFGDAPGKGGKDGTETGDESCMATPWTTSHLAMRWEARAQPNLDAACALYLGCPSYIPPGRGAHLKGRHGS